MVELSAYPLKKILICGDVESEKSTLTGLQAGEANDGRKGSEGCERF